MEQGGSAEQMEVSPVEALAFGDRFEDSFTKICYKAHMDKIGSKTAGHTSDLAHLDALHIRHKGWIFLAGNIKGPDPVNETIGHDIDKRRSSRPDQFLIKGCRRKDQICFFLR